MTSDERNLVTYGQLSNDVWYFEIFEWGFLILVQISLSLQALTQTNEKPYEQ